MKVFIEKMKFEILLALPFISLLQGLMESIFVTFVIKNLFAVFIFKQIK